MIFDQSPYACRMDWGLTGIRQAAARGDVIVVVDVLRFSSTTSWAAHHGALIYPLPWDEDAVDYAAELNRNAQPGQREVLTSQDRGKALSPRSFSSEDAGARYVIASPNGAACALASDGAAAVLAGALVNAEAAAGVAAGFRRRTGAPITVVACGERWKDAMGGDLLRPSIEDYLGAGAILGYLDGSASPEAEVCRAAFDGVRDRLPSIVWESSSGRELRSFGLEEDLPYCTGLNVIPSVPVLGDLHFRAVRPE